MDLDCFLEAQFLPGDFSVLAAIPMANITRRQCGLPLQSRAPVLRGFLLTEGYKRNQAATVQPGEPCEP